MPRRQIQLALRGERRPSRSSIQAGGDRGLNFFPRNDVVWIGFVVREATIEFDALSVCQRSLGGNAIPKLFDEKQAFRNAEPLNT